MSGDHNEYQKTKSYLDDFECPRCGHCCQALETEQEWVGLTDDEIDAAWRSVDYTVAYEQFRIDVARAVEQRLKKRNT